MENKERKNKKATQEGADLAQAAREYAQHIAVSRVQGDWKSEEAKELASLISLFPVKDLADAFANGVAWQKQRLIDKACDVYCKLCDTKECVDDECNWVKKFRKAMEK